MSEVLLGVAMFTGVILLVVMLLLAARSKLVSAGDVTIEINGDPGKALRVPAGPGASNPSGATQRKQLTEQLLKGLFK